MNEKTEKYVKLLKKHVDRIAIVVLWLFFAALAGLWYLEQDTQAATASEGKPAVIDDMLPKNPAWINMQMMSSKPDLATSFPEVLQVRQYNMFDYKSVANAQDIERNISSKLQQAQDAEKAGRMDDALKLGREILTLKPTHRPARELVDRVEAKKKAAPAGGAVPPR